MNNFETAQTTPAHKGGNVLTLKTLNTFAVDVITLPDEDELFWYVAKNVVGRLQFLDCVIYKADEAETELTQVAALGAKTPYDREILNPLKIPFGQGITGRVAQSKAAIIIDDLLKDQTYIPDSEPARSEICVPLVSQGRVVGVIDSEHPQKAAFDRADLEVLTTVAAMTSATLQLLTEERRSHLRYLGLKESHKQLSEEIQNRAALEAELFNVRKMEAVGQLTGGFAHDFNNLLTVISGNLEFVGLAESEAQRQEYLDEARTAARRAAKLIQDLLAFSQRMHLRPITTNLNTMITTICAQNRQRLPGDIQMDLAEDILSVQVDPTAAEIALVNLMINARDAMPHGGTLSIKKENIQHGVADNEGLAKNIAPGSYVKLTVSDEGEGIPPEALDQIFDPFFTTKPVGAGTGLGLSMVLGFMQQSGGAVIAKPEVAQGATFELYFPTS